MKLNDDKKNDIISRIVTVIEVSIKFLVKAIIGLVKALFNAFIR